ncbi:DUF2069 domain-containing protein [Comamonas serinivorans]|uniref:DUF2069 domain-containing protein n=1 Tax=Comamonas serinivorans TaxID=1082851 RepID=UPI003AAABB83
MPPAPTGAQPTPSAAGLQAARRTRAAAVACVLALIALCMGWELAWAPTVPGGSWVLAAKALPLLPALPGLLRLRMYTYRWLSLLVWLYVTEGVVRAASEMGPSRLLALAEVALAAALFVACSLHVRLRLKHARAAATGLSTATDGTTGATAIQAASKHSA